MIIPIALLPVLAFGQGAALVPSGWDPVKAANKVMSRLVQVTAPQVKGAHDAEMAIVNHRAFIVAEANDVQPGESAEWPFVYVTLSVVNLKTMAVERVLNFARGGQAFDNETLPEGACFVPRILQKDAKTLRVYFASEAPGRRQAQTWFLDFDIARMAFENRIHRAKIKTTAGTFDMQPRPFHDDAAAHGFAREPRDYGLYIFDSFKIFDGEIHAAINNYPGGQNALALLNRSLDTFEVIGHYNPPPGPKLTESAVNRLPDGTWMAICRQDGGNANYMFSTSKDGRCWSANQHLPFVPNGTNSKPTFDRFGDTYYLGWQESTRIQGVNRSVFNIDVSTRGVKWERKYRFESVKSFQYPTFREYRGAVYLTVTQGDSSDSRKERIMFGRLQ